MFQSPTKRTVCHTNKGCADVGPMCLQMCSFLSVSHVPVYVEFACFAAAHRSAGQDVVASVCSLVIGVCECDVSALNQEGAEVDASSGMA